MYGAILGDIIGSVYEFRNIKTKEFPLFAEKSCITDDTVMTVAVAHALLEQVGILRHLKESDKSCQGREAYSDEDLKLLLVKSMQDLGNRHPWVGYGKQFFRWLAARNPKPYGSWGNGSAMRVASIGWLFEDLASTRKIAALSAEVSHNHPEGIKGAEAVAAAVFLARTGGSKDEIKEYICREFKYDLSRTCDEIRPEYHHVESCMETVPEAITAFLEGESFEDVIRTAISLGGDSDTLTCISGSIAEAFYGVPEYLMKECENRMPEDLKEILYEFNKYRIPAEHK